MVGEQDPVPAIVSCALASFLVYSRSRLLPLRPVTSLALLVPAIPEEFNGHDWSRFCRCVRGRDGDGSAVWERMGRVGTGRPGADGRFCSETTCSAREVRPDCSGQGEQLSCHPIVLPQPWAVEAGAGEAGRAGRAGDGRSQQETGRVDAAVGGDRPTVRICEQLPPPRLEPSAAIRSSAAEFPVGQEGGDDRIGRGADVWARQSGIDQSVGLDGPAHRG